MQITMLLVEDNPITSQNLKEMLQEYGFAVLGVASNMKHALELMDKHSPDILLVDINLTREDEGIDLVRNIRQFSSVPVIYLTAYTNKTIVDRALKTKPSAYLTKPYGEKDVIIAVELAFLNHWNNLLSSPQRPPSSFIFLKEGEQFRKVELDDILYLQAEGSYTRFVTEKRELTLSGNLTTTMQKIKNNSFLRVHRSYIINIKNVTGLDSNYVFIGEKTIPIGRSYKEESNRVLRKIS